MLVTSARFAPRVAAGAAMAVLGCGSPFEDATRTFDGQIVTADTTLLIGESAAFEAVAIYGVGPGRPQDVVWTTSDTTVATVSALSDKRGSVVAQGPGQAWIRVLVNQAFPDSAQVSVVEPGAVRWRVAAPAGPALNGAVGSDSLLRLVTAGGALSLFGPTGSTTAPAMGCDGAFGPSLDASGSVYLTGDDCSRRFSASGSLAWSASIGDPGSGLAIAADEAAVVVHSLPDTGGTTGAVAVSRLAFSGAEVWRDTLRPVVVAQRSAPAIATNGDIYVAWRAPADSSWLSRITSAGMVRWTMPLPGEPRYTSPALEPTRVTVTYLGGLTVFDTSGAVVWSRQFVQDNPAATDSTAASSPVISRSGNLYVQTVAGLHGYTGAGVPLWTADSLGGGSQSSGVGSPALLTDTTVVVVRGQSRVCGVRPSLGVPRWCGPSLGTDLVGGVTVSFERTIFVARAAGELIALYSRFGPETLGWPTDGGSHRRARRR